MTAKRLQWLFAFFTLLAGVVLYAQNPVSIAQLGRSTAVTTTLPVSGSVTVSGTVSATQSGTWTVQQGTPPWTVTGTGTAGTAASGVVTVQGIASMTPLLVTPAANSAVNVAQFGGNNVVTGTGAGGNGIPRVTISSDSSLAANQSVNTAQFGGTNVVTGTGAGGSGIPRVTISNDSSLAANQSVNVAQMNGVTVTMGAGATGTGVQRTNDVSSSATGAAPPASGAYIVGLGSGATGGFLVGIPVGDTQKPISITSGATTLIVTGVSGRHVRITHLDLVTAVANNVAVISGTGATCGTGTAGIAGGTTSTNGWNFAANGGIAMGSGLGIVAQTQATGDSVCIITSSAGPLAGSITYAIY